MTLSVTVVCSEKDRILVSYHNVRPENISVLDPATYPSNDAITLMIVSTQGTERSNDNYLSFRLAKGIPSTPTPGSVEAKQRTYCRN